MQTVENHRLVEDDPYRIDAVKRYQELNLEKEKTLEGFVNLACQICKVPIALITFIDEHKQNLITKRGLEIKETLPVESFCTHTIRQDGIFIIHDARKHVLFSTNPAVTGYPYIRYYAGLPLKNVDGYNLGAFCVIDLRPRNLNKLQIEGLKMVARQVITMLELRMSLKIIQEQKLIINSSESELIDKILAQNNQLREISKIQSHQIRGPVSTIKGLIELIKEEKPVVNPEYMSLLEVVVEQLDNSIKDIVKSANTSLIQIR